MSAGDDTAGEKLARPNVRPRTSVIRSRSASFDEDAPGDRPHFGVARVPEAQPDVLDEAALEEGAVAALQAHLVVVGDDEVALRSVGHGVAFMMPRCDASS
jgi:hypothetical protein